MFEDLTYEQKREFANFLKVIDNERMILVNRFLFLSGAPTGIKRYLNNDPEAKNEIKEVVDIITKASENGHTSLKVVLPELIEIAESINITLNYTCEICEGRGYIENEDSICLMCKGEGTYEHDDMEGQIEPDSWVKVKDFLEPMEYYEYDIEALNITMLTSPELEAELTKWRIRKVFGVKVKTKYGEY